MFFLNFLLPIFLTLFVVTIEAAKMVDVEVRLEPDSILHVWMRATHAGHPAQITVHQHGNNSNNDKPVFSIESTEMDWLKFTSTELTVNGEASSSSSSKAAHAHHRGPQKSLIDLAGKYVLSWDEQATEVSYLYVFEKKTVKTEGIRPAFVGPKTRLHEELYRHSFHLRTPLGWANEPNGFTRTGDKFYHIFYQHIPHQRRPRMDNDMEGMHWGHVISTDLINWVHQPVFLLPEYHIEDRGKKGQDCMEQWFSGSAVPMAGNDHGLRVFVTSFHKARKDKAIQTEMQSSDGILLNADSHGAPIKRAVVAKFPDNPMHNKKSLQFKPFNFRDPNVFRGPQGHFYMTLGTEDVTKEHNQGGVILLYRTKEANLDSEWEYQNVLITDNRDGMGNIECPGLFPLGDASNKPDTPYALVYAREHGHVDHLHRARDTLIQLGKFDGKHFVRNQQGAPEQSLDFAHGSYGHQGFYEAQSGEALIMGWLSVWNDWDMAKEADLYSSETLPRIVKIAPKGNGLLIGPHSNVAEMIGDALVEEAENGTRKILLKKHGHKTAYLRVEIDQAKLGGHGGQQGHEANAAAVVVDIQHPMYEQLEVRVSAKGLELVKKLKEPIPYANPEWREEQRPLVAQGARPDLVHIYVDVDSLEIYGELHEDGGTPRWPGTTWLAGNGAVAVTGFEVKDNTGALKGYEAFGMKVPKLRGYLPPSAADEEQQKKDTADAEVNDVDINEEDDDDEEEEEVDANKRGTEKRSAATAFGED